MKVSYGPIVDRASGRFGGTVFSNHRGTDLIRRYAKPSNPNTVGQRAVRLAFSILTAMFTQMPTYTKAGWTTFATGKKFTNRNAFVGKSADGLAGGTDLSTLVMQPGDASTLQPVAFTPVGGSNQITTTITTPTPPTGWTINRVVACAVEDFDPSTMPTQQQLQIYEKDDTSNPYSPTIDIAAAHNGTFRTYAFIEWSDPQGNTRYSAAVPGGTVVVS